MSNRNNQDDPNKSTGALFYEEPEGKQPDIKGYIEVTGTQIKNLIAKGQSGDPAKLWIAGWYKTAASGSDYIFLSGEGPQDRQGGQRQSRPQQRPQQRPQPRQEEQWTDDDIPF